MSTEKIKILAIETSCDETSAAVIGVLSHPKLSRSLPKVTLRGSLDSSATPQNDNPTILSNIVSSQIDLHAKTGGVVPEVASRAHMEAILPVINEALITGISNYKFLIPNEKLSSKLQDLRPDLLSQITHIAVTSGPGLIGSLLVGFNTAKALAYSLNIPIIPINHIEGHIYSALAQNKTNNEKLKTKNNIEFPISKNSNIQIPKSYQLSANSFPILALTVSGGHTSLTIMKDHGVYENIGSTLDDAAGEAFDKVAKLLDLGYPGGPIVSKLAEKFRNRPSGLGLRSKEASKNLKPKTYDLKPVSIVFPRPIINDGTFNFSFSGLKTAVLTHVLKLKASQREIPLRGANNYNLTAADKSAICYAFEEAVVDVLVTKTIRACEKYKPASVILAGGVAANKRLREVLSYKLQAISYKLILPPAELCGDNAAMIGIAAYYHILKNNIKTWNDIKVDSNLKL